MKIGNELQFSLMNKAINEQKAAENTSANKIYKAKNNDVEVTKTAQDFVSLFYQQFLGVMMPPDKPDPIFGKAGGQKFFNEMMVDEYAKIMSKAPNDTLTASIKTHLLKMQEDAHV
jgi:hypothetical protein